MKIVTLLPSATEIVCALGLEDSLVAVSHSCNFPPSVLELPKATRTHVPYEKSSAEIDAFVRDHLTGHEALYDLQMDVLQTVSPDVIISQTLCDVCAVSTGDVLEALNNLPSSPLLIDLQPNTLDDVFNDINNVARQLSVERHGRQVVDKLLERRDSIAQRTSTIPTSSRPRVAFLEWLHPPFNGGHWNPQLVNLAGGIDVIGNPGGPSSTQDWASIAALDPDLLYIACCGFRVGRALDDLKLMSEIEEWRQLRAVQEDRVHMTDGNAYFSCPGPRLLDGLEIMAHTLHPKIHPSVPFA